MTILIHGDDTEKSRNHLLELKKKYPDALHLEGKTLQTADLIQALEGGLLFGEEKLIVVENLLKNKDEQIFVYLKKNTFSNLVLWEGKEIGKRDQALLGGKVEVFAYKLPVLVFKFIDLICEKKIKEALAIYSDFLSQAAPEMISHLLVRQWRFLILIKSEAKTGPSDFVKLQSWQKGKLTQMVKFYTLEQLISFYRKLLTINFREKTGQANLSLAQQLEMLFLFELEN